MDLITFFVSTQYGLTCKYGTIFQTLVYNLMQNWVLWYMV